MHLIYLQMVLQVRNVHKSGFLRQTRTVQKWNTLLDSCGERQSFWSQNRRPSYSVSCSVSTEFGDSPKLERGTDFTAIHKHFFLLSWQESTSDARKSISHSLDYRNRVRYEGGALSGREVQRLRRMWEPVSTSQADPQGPEVQTD